MSRFTFCTVKWQHFKGAASEGTILMNNIQNITKKNEKRNMLWHCSSVHIKRSFVEQTPICVRAQSPCFSSSIVDVLPDQERTPYSSLSKTSADDPPLTIRSQGTLASFTSNNSTTATVYVLHILFWCGKQVLHVLDLLKVKRHVGRQHNLNDQCSQFSDVQAHHRISSIVLGAHDY